MPSQTLLLLLYLASQDCDELHVNHPSLCFCCDAPVIGSQYGRIREIICLIDCYVNRKENGVLLLLD